jgi:hypothetical protein
MQKVTEIKDYEKQIVKATIKMWIDWGAFLCADSIESEISHYTGNYNLEHRQALADCIQKEIDEIEKTNKENDEPDICED